MPVVHVWSSIVFITRGEKKICRRSGCGRQSLSLDEPLCREPSETEPAHLAKLPAEFRFLSGGLCGKMEGLCLELGLLRCLLIAQGSYRWRASSSFSLSGTGRLGLVLSRTIPFSEPCHSAARAQLVAHTPPTILSLQVCRHRRLLQRKTRTDIPRYHPTCHARGATASAAPNFALYGERARAREGESERARTSVCVCVSAVTL